MGGEYELLSQFSSIVYLHKTHGFTYLPLFPASFTLKRRKSLVSSFSYISSWEGEISMTMWYVCVNFDLSSERTVAATLITLDLPVIF